MIETKVGVRAEHDGLILRVTLDAPESLNAQTPAMWRRLAEIGAGLDADTRVVILSGSGRSFSAGLDRRMLGEGIPGETSLAQLARRSDEQIDAFIDSAQRAFAWWRKVPSITIAMVHGHAIGAGFQLALACDLMVVADDATLAMRETSLGLVPDLGGTGPLVDAVGYARALEICATGRFVPAEEAVRLGIAIQQVPQSQWDSYVEELVAPILAADSDAVSDLKSLLASATTGEGQLERERQTQIHRLHSLASRLGG